ncbi:glycosyltransferase family 39 protein, partial [Patescibacteria group bacterium]|nr:glycosyltransferase family 39 protein [Patescibacteria group bacterium]
YLSALAIAVTPFHSWHSHYSLSDVPMAFLCSWVIYFSSTVLFRENIKSYLWAGLFIGLSASTKYNGALMVLVLVLAHFLRVFSEPEEKIFSKFQNLIGAGVTSIFGFVVGTPYALLDYKTFVRTDSPKGALWQFTNVGKVNVPQHLQQLSNVFLSKLPDDFGYTLFILFVLGVIFTFYKKKDRVFWFLTIPSLISLYYISGFEKVRSHYFFMAYPTIILLAMSFLSEKVLTAKLHSLFTKLILLCVFLPPLFLSVKGSYIFSREDTRIILNNWLDKRSSSKNLIIDLEDKNIEGNLIFEQNNKLRRGPNIKVYEIN